MTYHPMARTLVALGCPLTVTAPDELRAAFKRLADEICKFCENR